MMDDQDIVNNIPKGSTNYSMKKKQYWDWPNRTVKPEEFDDFDSTYPDDFRSLADIKELVELRNEKAELVAKLAGSECTVNLLAVKSKELIDGLNKDLNKFKALAFLITPEVIDLVRCGIGGNYGGNRYIEKMEKTHAPILSMLQALKVGV
jgi:hypothetical protein